MTIDLNETQRIKPVEQVVLKQEDNWVINKHLPPFMKFNLDINPLSKIFDVEFISIGQKDKLNNRIDVIVEDKVLFTMDFKYATNDMTKQILNYSMLKSKKWTEVNNIKFVYSYLSNGSVWINEGFLEINKSAKPLEYPKKFVIGENGIKLNVVNTISIDNKNNKFEYNTAVLKPTKHKNLFQYNQEWFEVSVYNNNKFKSFLPVFEVKTLDNFIIDQQKQKIDFSESKKEDSLQNHLVKTIKFLENTEYEYFNNTVQISTSSQSNKGYTLPYNFYGDFTPKITFDFDIFKNISATVIYQIDKPILNSQKGIIKISLNEQNSIENIDFKKNFYSLRFTDLPQIFKTNVTLDDVKNLSFRTSNVDSKWAEHTIIIDNKKKEENEKDR